ncbi:MAG: YbaB/EbfC family nucleoid-associated protein [Dehalococcoidia bacterium]
MKQKDMLKQAQQLQSKMAKAQEELANETVEGTAGGGAVTVTVTGQQDIKSIKISPEVVDPEDVEMLEDMIMAATSDAMGKAKDLMEKRLGSLTGGFNIPGL